MARKKSVSISRKPSASGAASAEAVPDAGPVWVATPVEPPAVADPSFGPLGWAVYGTVFWASYSVVFSAILLGKLIPGSGLIGRALHDGADAAERQFTRP